MRFPDLSLIRARAPAHALHCCGMPFDRGRGRMRVAITFCDQAEHERCNNEDRYASLSRREAESLPHFIEFETPTLFNHEYLCEFFRVYLLAGRHGLCKLKLSLYSASGVAR